MIQGKLPLFWGYETLYIKFILPNVIVICQINLVILKTFLELYFRSLLKRSSCGYEKNIQINMGIQLQTYRSTPTRMTWYVSL